MTVQGGKCFLASALHFIDKQGFIMQMFYRQGSKQLVKLKLLQIISKDCKIIIPVRMVCTLRKYFR
jgi:hypothetical protein